MVLSGVDDIRVPKNDMDDTEGPDKQMSEVVNGRPAPKWAFNIAIMIIVALLSYAVSDRAAAAKLAAAESEIGHLENRITAIEAIEPRLGRIEDKLDNLDIYLRGPQHTRAPTR